MIRLEDINIGFGNRILLSDGNARFEAGTLTALIGRNGSGKSTLLRVIAGLNRHYTGSVLIGERDSRRLTPLERARLVAFVTTERTRIAAMRCRDIVAMGRAPYTNWAGAMTPADERITEESLEAVGMTGYADRMMQTMSDGECQRIMIARALAQDTPVLLLDEPTSFLDMPGRYELAALLGKLAHTRGKCVIFSTHELDIATQTTDMVALIDGARLLVLPSAEMAGRLPETSLYSSAMAWK